jgi:hypothetical protein
LVEKVDIIKDKDEWSEIAESSAEETLDCMKRIIKGKMDYDDVVDENIDMELLKDLVDMAKNVGLSAGDLARMSSWGVNEDGELVLLDYGLDSKIYKEYYK